MNWFKFDPTKWLTGRIQRAPDNVQVAFIRLCCIYWVEECNMDAERAELECGESEYQYLIKFKIIKQIDNDIYIDFLDDNMGDIMATSKKNSDNAKKRWQEKKYRKDASAMPKDATEMRAHEVAMPNHAEEIREEEKRREEKRREKEAWFKVFWDKYQKKKDNKKCLDHWLKLSIDEINAALDKVDAYVASTPDVTYRKNPLTWLNGKCWQDEIIKPKQLGAQTKSGQALERNLAAEMKFDENGTAIL
jgi:hypothetical protein